MLELGTGDDAEDDRLMVTDEPNEGDVEVLEDMTAGDLTP